MITTLLSLWPFLCLALPQSKRSLPSLAAAALALGQFGAAGPAGAAERLSGPDLQALVAESVATTTVRGDVDLTITFDADGAMNGHAATLLFTAQDSGVWAVAGDTVCLRWKEWQNAEEACFHVEKSDAGFSCLSADGRFSGEIKLARKADQVVADNGSAEIQVSFLPGSSR